MGWWVNRWHLLHPASGTMLGPCLHWEMHVDKGDSDPIWSFVQYFIATWAFNTFCSPLIQCLYWTHWWEILRKETCSFYALWAKRVEMEVSREWAFGYKKVRISNLLNPRGKLCVWIVITIPGLQSTSEALQRSRKSSHSGDKRLAGQSQTKL